MEDPHPLVALANSSEVKTRSQFVDKARQIDSGSLSDKYKAEIQNAPHRHETKKPYFVGHDGIPSTTKPTNRLEEHLALALWNEFHDHPLETPLGGLRLLDYQVPLKAKQSDHGVGKIDLLGILPEGRVCVLELKVGGPSPDAPLRATIEGLAYCAMLQANLSEIVAEVHETFGLVAEVTPPKLLVIAPTDYWNSFRGNRAAEGWERAMQDLGTRITEATQVGVEFLQLDGFEFEVGHEGSRPALTATGVCTRAI